MSGYQELRDEGHERKMGIVSRGNKNDLCGVGTVQYPDCHVAYTNLLNIKFNTHICMHAH